MGKRRLFGSLILAVVLALIVSTAYADGEHGIAKAISVQDAATDKLLSLPDVVGTAVGHGPDNRPAIFVLTEKAGVRGIPTKIDGVPVLQKAVGKIEAFARGGNPGKPGGGGGGGEDPVPVDPTGKFPRPVPIGVSTGHVDITAGTIGARVVDSSGNVYALSNNHVYADENLATIGDNVLQPGVYDGGVTTDAIGTLANYVPIDFSATGDNRVDAAIAATSTSMLDNSTPFDGYGTPSSSTLGAAINMKVMKYGRTTGQTSGSIWAINATVNVGYSTGVAKFVDQIIVFGGTFSAGGDSGSLVVADGKGRAKANKGKPVGLLFAGSSTTTVINPIDEVLTSLGVSIDGN